jgi:hypothetical protein
MSYTNAQVVALVKAQNAEIAGLRAEIRALVSGKVATVAAAPTTVATVEIPVERAPKAAKVACSAHLDHKGGKGFSVAGMAAHRTWCEGQTVAIAS